MRCTPVGRSWNKNRSEKLVFDLHAAASCGAGGPSPLEVEAAEMACDVHDFANKEEPGDFAKFHSSAGELTGVHATSGDFGFFITFGTCGCDDPFVNLTLESFERGVRPISWSMEIKPARGKTVRKNFLQRGAQGRHIAGFAQAQGPRDVTGRSQVHADGFAALPVRRNLQDRGAAQATMGD